MNNAILILQRELGFITTKIVQYRNGNSKIASNSITLKEALQLRDEYTKAIQILNSIK